MMDSIKTHIVLYTTNNCNKFRTKNSLTKHFSSNTGWRRFYEDIEMMLGHKPNQIWRILWCFVTPIMMAVSTWNDVWNILKKYVDVIKWKCFPRLCPPATGEFLAQMPVTRSFDVFSDMRLDERLSKRPCSWRFETPSRPLWRHCNETCNLVRHGRRRLFCSMDMMWMEQPGFILSSTCAAFQYKGRLFWYMCSHFKDKAVPRPSLILITVSQYWYDDIFMLTPGDECKLKSRVVIGWWFVVS